MADFVKHTYQWKGRTFKTLRGLHNLASGLYGACGLSFEADAMVLSFRNGAERTRLLFNRTLADGHTSIIEAQNRT